MPITLASIVVGLIVSGIMAGASYLYMRFTQKPLDIGDNNFEVNPTDTRAHLPVVYGRAKLGASRIFTKTNPTNINIIVAVYACCHGEIGDFEAVWFDKEKVIDYTSESLSKDEGYNMDRWSWDGKLAATINKRLGSFNPLIYDNLKINFGSAIWTDWHLGANVASINISLKLPSGIEDRQRVFPSGFPQEVLLQVKGLKVQDIRQLLIIHNCEIIWSYSNSNVTQSSITGKVGTNAVRATIGAGAGTNTLLFCDNFSVAKDLSSYNAVVFWFRSSVDTIAGDLQLLLDNTDNCESPRRTINLPHFDANKWKRVIVNFNPNDTDLSSDNNAIKSIGIKQVTDIGVCTLDIDDIWATIYEFDYTISSALVEDCEDTWNKTAVPGVTLSTTPGINGNAARATILGLANNTIIMTEAIPSQSWSDYSSIQFWIRSSIQTHQGDLQLLIDDAASPLLVLDIPALKAGIWRKCELDFFVLPVINGSTSISIKINSKIHGDSSKTLGAADTEYTIDIDDVYKINRITIGDNPALCAYDYITNPIYGDGAEPSEMDEASFITEANYCDEIIASPLNPPGACTAKVIKAPGLLKGGSKYSFKVTFIKSDGTESKVGTPSNPVKTSVNKSKRQIQLTNIPIADSDDIKQRKIYATKGNGVNYFYYKTIGNNKDTTLDVNFADEDLGDIAPTNPSITKNLKRFTCNGIIDTAREIKVNLEDLLTSCRGNIFYESGKYVMFIKKPTTAETTIALTEDNIIGDWKWAMPAAKEMANIIKISYINPHEDYATDYVVWPKEREVNQYLIDDNYFENIKEINLNYTFDAIRAKQIGMVVLKESRDLIKASCKCNEEALKLRVGSEVNVTHSTPSWVAKPFWVEGIAIAPDGNIMVSLSSYTASNYTHDAITEDEEESTSEDIPAMEEEEITVDIINEAEGPPAITGLEIIHNRGNDSSVFGSDFEVRWNAVTERKNSSGYAITDYSAEDLYSDITSYSSEGIRYLVEVKFSGIADSIKINNVKVNSKIAYSEITTKTTFKFSLADNIEAAKKIWKNHSTHANYNTYYGVPQRQITISIATLNEKNRKSVYIPKILTNPAPDMNDSTGANTSPVLKALKSGLRVQFIHPYQEYDISHFMLQYAEVAFTNPLYVNTLKKIRVSSAITVNSTDDELDSTQYKVDIDGLDPKKTYYVRVRPHDTYGAGTYSGTASIVPGLTDDDADGDIVAPLVVTGLNFSVLANGNLRGSWTLLAEIDISEYIYDWRAVNDITAVNPPTLTEIENEITAGGKACYGIVSSVMLKGSAEATTKNQFIIQSPKVNYKYFFKVRARNTSRKLGNWPASWTTHSTAVPGLAEDDLPQKWAMYKFLGTVTAVDATHVSVSITGGSGSTGLKKKTNAGSSNIALNNLASTAFTGTQFIAYVGTATLAIKTEAQMDADSTFVAIAKIVESPSGKCNVLMMLSATDFNISAYGGAFNQVDTLILTGTTIQTATSGARVVLGSSGIQAYNSSGTQRVQISNDGSGWLGASGKLWWDTAGNLTVTGVVADSVAAENIVAGTITGSTLQTAASGKRFKVSSSNNHAEFYGDRGDATIELLATIGITPSGADNIIGNFGNLNVGNDRDAIWARSYSGYAIFARSNGGVGIQAIAEGENPAIICQATGLGDGMTIESVSGYGLNISTNTNKAPLHLGGLTSDPTNGSAGDIYYNQTTNKLRCHNGTIWNDLF